eukprot:2988531-Lingulodinium_polyedra.AAC.1
MADSPGFRPAPRSWRNARRGFCPFLAPGLGGEPPPPSGGGPAEAAAACSAMADISALDPRFIQHFPEIQAAM